jgi:hypothetical protein
VINNPERNFLETFFQTLNEQEIQYSVIRNYETLPETVAGTDIDIVIKQEDYTVVTKALKKAVPKVGYTPWKEYPKNYNMMQISFAPLICQNPRDVVRIDFMLDGVKWLGHDVIKEDELWQNRVKHNGIWVLGSFASLSATLLGALLSGSVIKEKYVTDYNQLEPGARQIVNQHLTDALGNYGRIVVRRLESGVSFKADVWKIRYHFMKSRGEVKALIKGCLSWTKTALRRAIYPPGLFVVLAGPDGCGKSTLSALMQERCNRLFPGIDHFHLFPKLHIFSFLDHYSRKRWEDRLKKGSEWQHRNQHFPFWKSVLRGLYLLFRFWTGYMVWIYPRLARAHLVLGERWSFDLLYDPASKGISLPYAMRKILFFLMPKPCRVFVMKGSPEEISRRKPELPKDEIERQIKAIEINLKPNKKRKWVTSAINIETTFQDIMAALVSS